MTALPATSIVVILCCVGMFLPSAGLRSGRVRQIASGVILVLFLAAVGLVS